MPENTKGRSPFYPGQPVPADLFVGRANEIDRILTRGAGQVAQGKPIAVFTQGEYGIGKSSIAGLVQRIAEDRYGLHGIYATLGGCRSIDDISASVLEATLRSGVFHSTRSERVRNWLGKYITGAALFGFSVDFKALRQDAPQLSTALQMLEFLRQARNCLQDTGVNGVFLVLDEINGVASNEQFANFIKGLVDSNAMSDEPLPLLLMLCGVEERRREMIQMHQPVDRIFDIVDIGALTGTEVGEFFGRAFGSVQMTIQPTAIDHLTYYSGGFPKIMHLLGDAAFWCDNDGVIDESDALNAVLMAAEEVGKKYVDQQVYKALRSEAYHSILKSIGAMGPGSVLFKRSDVLSRLKGSEKVKFDNFVNRMKYLKVIRQGDALGEYVFNMRMVQVYIWLQSRPKPGSGSE